MSNLKILFFGTPDFASSSLKFLNENGMNIIGVVTQPDRTSGRENKINFSPVKTYALSTALPVFQPETLKNNAFLDDLTRLNPDIIVVVAYGKIFPDYILSYPDFGCINLHGSILPKYRGAAPIQRAVLNGETESGVTTMIMDKGIDTGDMLLCEKVKILPNDTTENLFDKLALIGGPLLLKTIKHLENKQITPIKQEHNLATYAEKLTVEDEKIDFFENSAKIHNKIRGMSSFPGAFVLNNDKKLKLFDSFIFDGEIDKNAELGEIFILNKEIAVIKCGENSAIAIKKFKPEGKVIMSVSDMINGRKIAIHDILK